MNTKTLFAFKTDKKIKEAAQKAAAEIGVPLSTILNAFLKQFSRDKEIVFSARSYHPTPYLEKILEAAEQDIKQGKNLSPVFDRAEDAVRYLHSQA